MPATPQPIEKGDGNEDGEGRWRRERWLHRRKEQVSHLARHSQPGHVGCLQFPVVPARLAADARVLALGVLVVWVVADRAADVGRRDSGGCTGQPVRLRPGLEQLRGEARGNPAPLLLREFLEEGVYTSGRGRDASPVAVGTGQLFPHRRPAWREATRVPVLWHVGVEVDDVRDPLGTRSATPATTMPP